VTKVIKVRQEMPVFQVNQVIKVFQAFLEEKDLLVCQVFQVHKVYQAPEVYISYV
jgi:hypothetical protein